MVIEDLEAVNAATLAAIRENPPASLDPLNYPYFGFYTVDLFECPPFLMFTSHDCPRGWNILFERYFEPYSMKIWCRLARTATGILDIGAHVGVYSLAAASLRSDISIHAFEPNPYAFARLRMHKLVNGYSHLTEHTVAVGNDDRLVKFGWVKKPTLQIASGAGIGGRKGGNTENTVAQMIKLDGKGLAATVGTRPLVKIDVEGAEALTMAGMQEVLALMPDIILETFSQNSCDEINAMILPLGYRVYKIHESEGRLTAQDRLEPAVVQTGNLNQLLTRDGSVSAMLES